MDVCRPFAAQSKRITKCYQFEYCPLEHENVLSWVTHGDVSPMTIARFAKFGLLDKMVEYLSLIWMLLSRLAAISSAV